MKFGKTLLSQQLPEYGAYYINYKALKKVIKSLSSTIVDPSVLDENATLQANKATFFFKLERELDRVNAFYLSKEAELRARFETLLEKKRYLTTSIHSDVRHSANFIVLHEGFQQFERDLNKLQQYVELNATGFYKALKKWDKRSKSQSKELYLSRRVEIQPVFNRDILSNLVDTATSILLELEGYANGEELPEGAKTSPDLKARASQAEDDINSEVLKAVLGDNPESLRDILDRLRISSNATLRLTRVYMQALHDATEMALRAVAETKLIDFAAEDEISGRTCLHEAVLSGKIAAVQHCLEGGSDLSKVDVYGRTCLHYACMQGKDVPLITLLLQNNAPVNVLDHNISSPLHYAILNGNIEAVELLLQYGAESDPKGDSDYIPLSMACAQGHTAIAEILLENRAQVKYNAEGLLPLHLVARAGHLGLSSVLHKHGSDLEAHDKFSNWTAIFFAASEGHVEVIRELLACGAKVNVRDEDHHSPMYYAAWEGHQDAVDLLLRSGGAFGGTESTLQRPQKVVADEVATAEDTIPDLLLPPPILPVRSYGHNYLDRATLIQLKLVNPSPSQKSPVRWYLDHTLFSSSKLTISIKSTRRKAVSGLIPHTVSLPVVDTSDVFTFQIDSLESLCLELEIYPTFGSKVIAKGIAPPDLFHNSSRADCTAVVPLLDPRLQLIGQVTFDYIVIAPFSGIQFDIHSRIETYWKSTQSLSSGGGGSQMQHLVTDSSLVGTYIRVPVQITRDGVPVVCPTDLLPLKNTRLSSADVDCQTFQEVCHVVNPVEQDQMLSETELQSMMTNMYMPLSQLLESVGIDVKLNLHITATRKSSTASASFEPYRMDVNVIIDAVLATVFAHADSVKAKGVSTQPRSLFFSSSEPVLCTALNWKQPNYPVFLASQSTSTVDISEKLGDASVSPSSLPSTIARNMSIKDMVKFAKGNNLLGIIIDAEIALHTPALITTIKKSGLVLMTHSPNNQTQNNIKKQAEHGVDGVLNNGSFAFLNRIDV